MKVETIRKQDGVLASRLGCSRCGRASKFLEVDIRDSDEGSTDQLLRQMVESGGRTFDRHDNAVCAKCGKPRVKVELDEDDLDVIAEALRDYRTKKQDDGQSVSELIVKMDVAVHRINLEKNPLHGQTYYEGSGEEE